ncbi:MAG TPA: hypothetical protein VHD33_00990 [Legionellaceae bacterium]|nr:hypothetical protein [Legionellaceae bacterium]
MTDTGSTAGSTGRVKTMAANIDNKAAKNASLSKTGSLNNSAYRPYLSSYPNNTNNFNNADVDHLSDISGSGDNEQNWHEKYNESAPTRQEVNVIMENMGALKYQLEEQVKKNTDARSEIKKKLNDCIKQIQKFESVVAKNANTDQNIASIWMYIEQFKAHIWPNQTTELKSLQEIELEQARQSILSLRNDHEGFDQRASLAPAGEQAGLEEELSNYKKAMRQAVKHYIEIKVAHSSAPIHSPGGLGIQMQEALRQLNEIKRQAFYHTERQAPRNWSTWYQDANQTSTKRKALKSLDHLANSSVLKKSNESDEYLQKHLEVVQSLTHALFFMMEYSQVVFNEPSINMQPKPTRQTNNPVSEDVNEDDEGSSFEGSSIMNNSFTSVAHSSKTPQMKMAEDMQLINQEVMQYIKDILAELPIKEGAGLGQENKNWQFWGTVLKVFGTALLLSVSAVIIASLVGFNAPAAYVMSYVMAAKSISIVSTTLNYVTAKLSLDISGAAAVTAMSASSALVGMGMFTQYIGSASAFKSDVVKAAQEIEEVITSPKFGAKSSG